MKENDKWYIKRDNDRDLVFTGRLIGEGNHGTGGQSAKDWTRGTEVRIFRTTGGKYVVSVRQWSRWQGEGEINRAGVCKDPAELLDWLVRDCGGSLGPASKAAWEDAAATDPTIEDIVDEVIA